MTAVHGADPRVAAVAAGLRPTRIEVDLDAIRHNVGRLATLAGGAEVCAVVKADAYGHGAEAVARAAVEAGATWLAVALAEEGLQLRDAGIDARILVLSEPPVSAIADLLAADLTPTVYREPFIAVLDAQGQGRGRPVPVHLKVDTGMARVGVPPDHWQARFEQVATAEGVELEGLCTHLARADEPSVDTTSQQLAAFDRAIAEAARVGLHARLTHAANTAGVLLHPRSHHVLVRPGIGVYGLSPSSEVDAAEHGLCPALRLVSEVSFAKHVAAHTPVSYGHRWRAPEDGWVATVPIGYADGVPRRLTNRVQVLLAGRRRPVIGMITMDQVMVWCGDEEPVVGDEVVLLGAASRAPAAGAPPGPRPRPGADPGADPAPGSESTAADGTPLPSPPLQVRAEEWAEAADTVTYEIVSSLTARLPRIHLGVAH
ncbi:MAG: alanine racemase [Nitriliruptor sp.]|nr:MAG: alanine racemase [Nitriliruptor sp.]